DARHLPYFTPFEEIIALHTERVGTAVNRNPGNEPFQFRSLAEVHNSQNVLQAMRAAFRRNKGITREELQRMSSGRVCAAQITELHAEAEKIRVQGTQRAA